MEIIRTIDWMKQVSRAARDKGLSIGFVPTMGALHEGHLSLVRAASAGHSPVVVSIFVNPAQFGPQEDLSKYPRQLEKDAVMLEAEGVDYIFMPEAAEVYPPNFRTYVTVEGLADRLEGKSRPGHFRGVTTVVLKLLEIVQPHAAYFGRKDAQQARIIRQMARDLSLDAEIAVQPIVREPDGLAMSSRNAYLNSEERRAAASLSRALAAAAARITSGERKAAALLELAREVLTSEPLVRPDYVELVSAETFEPIALIGAPSLLLIAAYVGTTSGAGRATRLIDNLQITPAASGILAKL
ncbi:MAG TPA: pantoate--beta-alanine ligase [Candidatus Limnocylindrales bacterium]|nr:pantoate--beta-alanine ligase [Candidatus Limnocylindrales bacterium]